MKETGRGFSGVTPQKDFLKLLVSVQTYFRKVEQAQARKDCDSSLRQISDKAY